MRLIKQFILIIFLSLISVSNSNAKGLSATEIYTHQFPNLSWQEKIVLDNKNELNEYIIQISKDKKFKNIIDCDTIPINRYVSSEPLPFGKLYWRFAKISTNKNVLNWSKTQKIIIKSPDITIEVKNDNLKQSIKRAVELAEKNKIVCLNFIETNYYLTSSEKNFIELKNTQNIIFQGNGAKVSLLSANQSFCLIEECSNITIRGFIVDYPKEMTFLQGRILDSSADSGSIDVKIEEGFPTYDDKYFASNDEAPIMLLDPYINGRLKNKVPDYYQVDMQNIKKTGDRSYRLFFKNVTIAVEGNKNFLHDAITKRIANNFQKGDRFVHTTRSNIAGFIGYIKGGSTITFYDIINHGVGHFHYAGYFCSDMKFIKVKGLMKENWWWQGNADGIHLRSNRIGPWIEDVHFEGIGDDAIALYARPMRVNKIWIDGKKNTLELNPEHFYLQPNDEVSFFNPRDGKIILETTVKSINKHIVEFNHEIPTDLVIVGSLQEVDQIWNRSASCGNFSIRNSTFKGIRRFGAVFRAKKGVVEKCNFESCSTSAVVFTNETQYPNGLYCSDIIIRNNTIKDCGFANLSAAPIIMKFNKLHSSKNVNNFAQSYGPRNISIINNNFHQLYTNKLIEFTRVENAIIKGNKIDGKEIVKEKNIVLNLTDNVTTE